MPRSDALQVRKLLPRMSWHPRNLYNLFWRGTKDWQSRLEFTEPHTTKLTLFQMRWLSKKLVRAYHGDFIPEKVFKRWFLPDIIPDVRPRRPVQRGNDAAALEEFAGRNMKKAIYEKETEAKGLPPVGSLMFTEIERRLDVFVFRCCFAHSVYEAKRLVIHGHVKINGKVVTSGATRLAPGDMVSVDPKAIRFMFPVEKTGYVPIKPEATHLTPFALPEYSAPWLFVPSYIEPSYATCSAVYVRHPTARPGYSEIPTPYDADGEVMRFAWEWYVKRRPRMRSRSQMARMPTDRTVTREIIEKGRKMLWRDTEQKKKMAEMVRKLKKSFEP